MWRPSIRPSPRAPSRPVDSSSVFAGQLQAGDSFYSIGGERVYTSGDVTMLLDRCEGGTADIVVLRGGEKVRLPNAQVERRDFGGEQLYGFTIDVQEKTLGGTLGFSWNSASTLSASYGSASGTCLRAARA